MNPKNVHTLSGIFQNTEFFHMFLWFLPIWLISEIQSMSIRCPKSPKTLCFATFFLVCSHSNCGVILSRWFMCFYIYVFTCNHLKSFKVQTLPNLLPYCLPIYLCMYIFIFIFIYLQSPAVILSSDPPQPIARLSCLSMYIYFYLFIFIYIYLQSPAVSLSSDPPQPIDLLSAYLFIYMYIYIYMYVFIFIFIHLHAITCSHSKVRHSSTYCPTVCLPIYLYVYIYLHVCIYFYIYIFTCNHLQSF